MLGRCPERETHEHDAKVKALFSIFASRFAQKRSSLGMVEVGRDLGIKMKKTGPFALA
jgi:hypothetical protein